MKRFVVGMAGVFVAAGLVLPVFAAADLKIGVVKMDEVVRAFPDAKSADSRLKEQVDEYESERDLKIAKINDQKKLLEQAATEAQDKALSEAERDRKTDGVKEKLKALREMEQDLRELSSKQQRSLAEMEMRLRKHIMGKLKDIIGQYAKKNDFTVILDATAVGAGGVDVVLFSADKLDVTEAITQLVKEQPVTEPSPAKGSKAIAEKEVKTTPEGKKK